jgi:hypothetical protein
MKIKFLTLASLFAFILLPFSFAEAQSIKPGLWKATTTLSLNGITLPASTDEECVSAEKAADAKATISKELEKKGCSISAWNLKGKRLESILVCKNNDLEAQGHLRGQLSNESYDLQGDAEGTFKKIPASATLKLVGRWTNKCAKL